MTSYSYLLYEDVTINNDNYELINVAGYRFSIVSNTSQGVRQSIQDELFVEEFELDNNSDPFIQHQHRYFNLIAPSYASAIDWDDEIIKVSDMEWSA